MLINSGCVFYFVFNEDAGATAKPQSSGSVSPAAYVVPVVLLLLIIPALITAVFFYRRCVI